MVQALRDAIAARFPTVRSGASTAPAGNLGSKAVTIETNNKKGVFARLLEAVTTFFKTLGQTKSFRQAYKAAGVAFKAVPVEAQSSHLGRNILIGAGVVAAIAIAAYLYNPAPFYAAATTARDAVQKGATAVVGYAESAYARVRIAALKLIYGPSSVEAGAAIIGDNLRKPFVFDPNGSWRSTLENQRVRV